jgi:hypothetical protein
MASLKFLVFRCCEQGRPPGIGEILRFIDDESGDRLSERQLCRRLGS